MFAEVTLRRKWWRSDALWTGFLLSTPARFLPYLFDRLALARSQYWPREYLDRLTEKRLADLMEHARQIPYWREKFAQFPSSVSTFREHLHSIPTMTRTDFKAMKEEEYVLQDLAKRSLRDSTSGSTGSPFAFYLDRGALLSSWAIRDRQFTAASGGRFPILIFRADKRLRRRFYKPLFVYLRGYNDIAERFEALSDCIAREAPRGASLYMFPSTALALAQFMRAQKKHLPIKAVVAAGESITAEDRAFIEKTVGARFSLGYGTQESSCIAFECGKNRMHINEEDILVEISDENGKVVEDGTEGRVVITHLGYRVMPLIRYDNGDLGTIAKERCPCGRTLKTITLNGRSPVVIKQKDGYTITLTELSAVFNMFTKVVETFQIVHETPNEFVFRVVPGPNYDTYKDVMQSAVVRKLHPSSKTVFEEVPHIESGANGKAVYYIRRY